MANLTENQKIVLIAITGGLLTGGSFLGVMWARGKIDEEKAKIQSLDQRIAEAEGKKARIPQDEKDVIILRENVSEYVKILPEDSELTDFARTVNSFSTQAGISLRSLTPGQKSGGGKSAFSKYSYNMAFSGTLWQFLKFINSFESYRRFVSIPTFGLAAGKVEGGDKATDEVVHGFNLTVETYTYNQRAGGRGPVKIVNYRAKRDRLREEIYRARAKITVGKYNFSGARARRDIFVDPRVRKDQIQDKGAGGVGVALKQQLTMVDKLARKVKSLEERYQQAEQTSILLLKFELIREVKKGISEIEDRLAKLEEDNMITYNPYRLRLEREVREPMNNLRAKVRGKGPNTNVGIPMPALKGILKFMEDALIDGRIHEAIAKYEVAQEGLTFSEGDDRLEIARRIRDLHKKATIAQEFSRIRLNIEGVILIDNGISTVIINGRTYQEGDAIEDHLFLKEITPESVEFLYKGLVISKKQQ